MLVTIEQLDEMFRECDKNGMPKNRTLYVGQGVELNADAIAYVQDTEHAKVARHPFCAPRQIIVGIDIVGA